MTSSWHKAESKNVAMVAENLDNRYVDIVDA
jgi:hypothetical protein